MTSRLRHDALVAVALACALSAAWAWRDWANLSLLRLPDTDDVMRLQQVRDWLGGQSWFDLAQHRVGAGLTMHWSRLADLGPALLIVVARPLMGGHAAETLAVIAWPALLFAAALFLIARIARTLGGDAIAGTAAIVAGIAYPATTIFLPGRIDHHGLQIVLLLAALLGTLGSAPPRRAALAGLAGAASLIVGLETAPLIGLISVVTLLDWIAGRDRDGETLAAFAVGAFGGLVIGRIGFAGTGWSYPACDGFTRDAWTAAMTIAAAPILLASLSTSISGIRQRSVAAIAIGGVAIMIAIARAPDCLAPYGNVDPVLARSWLPQVEEAQSILTAGVAHTIGYLGVVMAGIAATIWRYRRAPSRDWAMLALLQTGSLAIAMIQLRGAYAGAVLAAPGLAAAIGHARVRGAMRLTMAWTISAGIVYPLAGQAVARSTNTHSVRNADCTSPALLTALAALPAGRVLAPIDAGPSILATSAHTVVAAPYHRNATGNRIAIGYYAGTPIAATRALERSGATYVVTCAATAPSPARLMRTVTLPDGAAIWTAHRE